MGKINEYFFDTYALFEIIHKNQNYSDYLKVGIITTKLNLMELHYIIFRLYGEGVADKAYERFKTFCVEISDEVIKQANEFKFLNKKRKLSYVDCIGYIISKMNSVKFLTGDRQFENMENVEFVK